MTSTIAAPNIKMLLLLFFIDIFFIDRLFISEYTLLDSDSEVEDRLSVEDEDEGNDREESQVLDEVDGIEWMASDFNSSEWWHAI
jgi:hypothetical protein